MTITETWDLTLDAPSTGDSDAVALDLASPPMVEAQVVEMRRSGCSIPTIARETGLTPARVTGILKRITEAILTSTSAADVRADALIHYDRLFELVMPCIVQRRKLGPNDALTADGLGEEFIDFKALHAALKIIEARRKLMGADVNPATVVDVAMAVESGESSTKNLDDFAGQVDRFMDFADQIAERGLGSGRQHTDISDEARAAGIWVKDKADAGIVEAEVVEEEAEPETAGRWVDGRFIPDA